MVSEGSVHGCLQSRKVMTETDSTEKLLCGRMQGRDTPFEGPSSSGPFLLIWPYLVTAHSAKIHGSIHK